MIAPKSSAMTRSCQSGTEVFVAWMFSILLVLIIPAIITVGIKERRARLEAQEKTLPKGRANLVRRKLKKLGGGLSAVEQILTDWCLVKK
jgi:hypothetical protein